MLLFPKAYELVSTVLATDTMVRVKGRVKSDDDSVSLSAQELTLPDVTEAPSGPVVISLPAVRCTPPVVQQLSRGAAGRIRARPRSGSSWSSRTRRS